MNYSYRITLKPELPPPPDVTNFPNQTHPVESQTKPTRVPFLWNRKLKYIKKQSPVLYNPPPPPPLHDPSRDHIYGGQNANDEVNYTKAMYLYKTSGPSTLVQLTECRPGPSDDDDYNDDDDDDGACWGQTNKHIGWGLSCTHRACVCIT